MKNVVHSIYAIFVRKIVGIIHPYSITICASLFSHLFFFIIIYCNICLQALNLITQQSKNYEAIRKVSGASLVNDIYVRDSSTGTFWFIGKVARVSDVSLPKAVEHQWPMIEEHAGRLQPSELDSKNRDLEIWCAPGDTELEVAYNNPETIFIKMRRNNDVEGSKDVKNVEVGFKGEMYEGGEEGFRTWRNEDGTPTRPQIKTGGN